MKQIVSVPKGFEKHPEVIKIKNRIAQLPITLLDKMKSHDILIKLVDEPITNVAEFTHLKGQVPRGWENSNRTWDDVPGIGGTHVVVVRIGYSDYGKSHGSVNLELHEAAHSIDSIIYDHLSSTKSFIDIWKKESQFLFKNSVYYDNYPEEYFAETFAMYYLEESSREKLKTTAPLTYTFFKNLQ
ncbi:anthrax toxin lethal factor-related metalloendopeptidase [Cytobacillus spartinae]